MRQRLAWIAVTVAGLCASVPGAAYAAAGDGSAGAAQYRGEVLSGPPVGSEPNSGRNSGGDGEVNTLGENATRPVAAGQQPAQEDAADGDSLPTTGLAVLTLALAGVALVAGGAALRRRTSSAGPTG